jgi:hypothetical protein
MALKCRIDNNIVYAPNGGVSALFKELEERYGAEKALELYALTETEEYKDSLLFDLDSNGEMKINSFVKFTLKTEATRDYVLETIDLQHKVSPDKIKDFDKLYVKGVFTPSYDALKSTGVFSEDEIYDILFSEEKQNNLKEFIENFQTIDSVNEITGFIKTSDNYNDIGLASLEDPSVVKDEIMTVLSEAVNDAEVVSLVSSLPYGEFVDRFNSDSDFKIRVIDIALSSSSVKIERDDFQTADTLMMTMDISRLDEVEAAANRIEDIDDRQLILEEFENLQDSLIDAGVELNVDEYDIASRPTAELKTFANIISEFASNVNVENTMALSNAMDNFTNRPATRVVDISDFKGRPSTLRYLDTVENEIDNFETKSLVKVKDNVYQKVKDVYSTDQLYSVLYSKVLSNPSIVPEGVLKSAMEDGKLSMEVLKNPVNEEFIMEDLKNYVMESTDTLPKGGTETREKIIIYKTVYGHKISHPIVKPKYTEINNENYLKTDFVSDFNKQRLLNKKNNSKLHNYFYRFFKVDHKGIRPINESPYTENYIKAGLDKIPSELRDNLIKYSTIAKNFNMTLSEPISDITLEARMNAQQNIYSVPKIEGAYQVVSDTEVISNKDNKQFVRIGDKTYEKILEYNGTSLFKELSQGDSLFRSTSVDKPTTTITFEALREYQIEDNNNVTEVKYASSEQINKINKKYFDCQ